MRFDISLRRSVNRGCPFGDDQWREERVRELGLESIRGQRGGSSCSMIACTLRVA